MKNKFFEDTRRKDKKFFIGKRLFSFNCRIMGVIGARGFGKTNFFSSFCFDDYIKTKIPFIWLRDTEESLDELTSNNCKGFLENFYSNKRYKSYLKGKRYLFSKGILSEVYKDNLSGEKIINQVAYFLPCSTYYKLKGNKFKEVRNVVYDEFIAESNQVKRGSRIKEFVNTIETTQRLNKKNRLFLLANALDLGDEILSLLDIKIKSDKYGYYVNREKSVVMYYAESSESFIKAKKESLSGLLLKNTDLEKNIVENKFLDTEIATFDKMPNKSILLYILMNKDFQRIRIYSPYKDDEFLYIMEDKNRDTQKSKRFVIDKELVGGDYSLITKDRLQFLKSYYDNNKIKYQFEKYKKILLDFIK